MPESGLNGNVFAIAIGPCACSVARVSERLSRRWAPLILWMMLIFSASTAAGAPRVSSFFLRPLLLWLDPSMKPHTFAIIHLCVRKTAHLTEYAILGWLAFRVGHHEPALARSTLAAQVSAAVIFCAAYATTDEFHQRYAPERQASAGDVLIDTAGAAAAIMATAAQTRRRST